MRTLYIDLASNKGGLMACVEGNAVTAQPVDHRMSDDQLLPCLTDTLQKAGWTFESLTHIGCVVGPGGFTSLRMAVACTNTIAHEKHIPSAGIHLSDLYRARAKETDVLWLHSTKAQELFVRGFGVYEQLWSEPTHISLEDLLTKIPSQCVWVGELIPAHVEALAPRNIVAAELQNIETVLPSFLRSLSYGTSLLQPWYGRGW